MAHIKLCKLCKLISERLSDTDEPVTQYLAGYSFGPSLSRYASSSPSSSRPLTSSQLDEALGKIARLL
ncbi:hypothetical protein CALVIDRAFT_595860 [Calocera viscosa TUFC12733]|uniref:Uncharacterized protein n=1 Tax=Calocera viscosa (strain TUFC12733) TaxID=1330018 RepID=A0A167QI01_CALVF|nr:hypothetical protein CALVIDRAFT_595860 [Calocera viscosa TUFC12733]